MRNFQRYIIALSVILLVGIIVCGRIVQTGNSAIAIIISSDNPLAFRDNPSLPVGDVRAYFLRRVKRRWPETNRNILPVDRIKNCPEQEVFYSKVLNMSASEVERYFIERQYQSGENLPDRFSSDKQIIDFVGDEIGAIGYVNINSLTTEARTKVKTILVIRTDE